MGVDVQGGGVGVGPDGGQAPGAEKIPLPTRPV